MTPTPLLLMWVGTTGPGDLQEALIHLTHAESERRIEAMERVVEMGLTDPKGIVPALARALETEHHQRRAQALLALTRIGGPEVTDALVKSLDHPTWEVRQAASSFLGTQQDVRAVPFLAGALKDPHPQVRVAAALSLGQLKDPSAVPDLLDALKRVFQEGFSPSVQEDLNQLNSLFHALGSFQDPRAIPILVEALETGDYRMMGSAGLLGRYGEAALPVLRRVMENPTSKGRWGALLALGAIRHPESTTLLVGALNDPQETVRSQALRGLNERPDAVPALLKYLNGHPEAEVRRGIAEMLGGPFKDIDAPLRPAPLPRRLLRAVAADAMGVLGEEDEEDEEAPVMPLGQIPRAVPVPAWLNTPEVTTALKRAAQDKEATVRRAALHSLFRLRAPSTLTDLLAALNDPNAGVRLTAAQSLGVLQDPASIPALKAALQDPDPQVKEAAKLGLEWLGELPGTPFKKRKKP